MGHRRFSWENPTDHVAKRVDSEPEPRFSAGRKGRSNQLSRMVCAEDSSRSTAAHPCRFRNRSWDFAVFYRECMKPADGGSAENRRTSEPWTVGTRDDGSNRIACAPVDRN